MSRSRLFGFSLYAVNEIDQLRLTSVVLEFRSSPLPSIFAHEYEEKTTTRTCKYRQRNIMEMVANFRAKRITYLRGRYTSVTY